MGQIGLFDSAGIQPWTGSSVGIVSWERQLGSSAGIDGRLIHQHDRDTILNGVDAAALSAFEILTVRVWNYRLDANRADQYVKQILRDHRSPIVIVQNGHGNASSVV